MDAMRDMTLIGRGRSAEVFSDGDGKAVKLYRPGWPEEVARYEAGILEAVDKLGLPAPRYFGMKTIEGRPALVFERIEGRSLLETIVENPLRAAEYGKKLARVHAEIHAFRGEGLPKERDRFIAQIERSRGKIGPLFYGLVDDLAKRSSEDFACHGDLHPDNILVNGDRMAVIDWMNAYSGTRMGDAARTCLMILSPFTPDSTPLSLRPIVKIHKRVMASSYLGEYRRLTGIGKAEIRAWLPLVAAVRLCDEVPGEEEWLLSIIARGPKGRRPSGRRP